MPLFFINFHPFIFCCPKASFISLILSYSTLHQRAIWTQPSGPPPFYSNLYHKPAGSLACRRFGETVSCSRTVLWSGHCPSSSATNHFTRQDPNDINPNNSIDFSVWFTMDVGHQQQRITWQQLLAFLQSLKKNSLRILTKLPQAGITNNSLSSCVGLKQVLSVADYPQWVI